VSEVAKQLGFVYQRSLAFFEFQQLRLTEGSASEALEATAHGRKPSSHATQVPLPSVCWEIIIIHYRLRWLPQRQDTFRKHLHTGSQHLHHNYYQLPMMSTSMKHKSIPATFNEKAPAATAKSPRPTSAPYPNFSKPLAKETAATTEPKLVAAEELQARIKAARRSRTATQPLPEAVRRKLDHSSDLIHPALRARSGVTPNSNRPTSHRTKSREDLSIDAVIRRLSMEIDGQNSTKGRQLPDDIPPVPTLPAFPPAASYRPRPRQTASRRSSMTMRRSPLSNVSSPDGKQEDVGSKEGC
jgi:hypothetical protein